VSLKIIVKHLACAGGFLFLKFRICTTLFNKTVDVTDAITASVTGVDGVGGLETRGKFRLGMPKTPIK